MTQSFDVYYFLICYSYLEGIRSSTLKCRKKISVLMPVLLSLNSFGIKKERFLTFVFGGTSNYFRFTYCHFVAKSILGVPTDSLRARQNELSIVRKVH